MSLRDEGTGPDSDLEHRSDEFCKLIDETKAIDSVDAVYLLLYL